MQKRNLYCYSSNLNSDVLQEVGGSGRRTWCDAMRNWHRIISRNSRSFCRDPVRSVARIWHRAG